MQFFIFSRSPLSRLSLLNIGGYPITSAVGRSSTMLDDYDDPFGPPTRPGAGELGPDPFFFNVNGKLYSSGSSSSLDLVSLY
jgi:hypothetical protein